MCGNGAAGGAGSGPTGAGTAAAMVRRRMEDKLRSAKDACDFLGYRSIEMGYTIGLLINVMSICRSALLSTFNSATR